MTEQVVTCETLPTKSVYPAIRQSTTFILSKKPDGMYGSGFKYYKCGSWSYYGCRSPHVNLETGKDPKVYVRRVKYSCGRPLCPVCYVIVCSKTANRAKARYSASHCKTKLHLSISHKDRELSRSEVRKALAYVGVKGGCIIEHPWRQNKKTKEWYYSPHYHSLGVGWVSGSKARHYEKTYGILVKNINPTKKRSVFGTIYYQLTHAVYRPNKHSISWFGVMAYNNLSVKRVKPGKLVCPICNQRLVKLLYLEDGDPKLNHNEGWFNPKDWCTRDGRTIDEG